MRPENDIILILRGAGHEAYLVGGCVRDMLLNREPKDYDIATSATPTQVQQLFPKTVLVGASFGVIKVITNDGGEYEVATYRKDHFSDHADGRRPSRVEFSLNREDDAARRDLTINSLYMCPIDGHVIGKQGREDLQNKLIRFVGDPEERINEDRLRIMRVLRFAVQLDFQIADKTWEAVKRNAYRITDISAERIRDELFKMLAAVEFDNALELLEQSGLLYYILPEVAAMVGSTQSEEHHPEGDCFVHTLSALMNLDADTDVETRLAMMLHDIGKPPTRRIIDGRITNHGHADVGADMAFRICRRLKLSNEQTEKIVTLVATHMKFPVVQDMRLSRLKKFISGPHINDMIKLHKADCLASHGKLDHYDFVVAKMTEITPDEARPPRLITGDDLIALGHCPGPKFKLILDRIEDLQLDGIIKTREEAVAYVLRGPEHD